MQIFNLAELLENTHSGFLTKADRTYIQEEVGNEINFENSIIVNDLFRVIKKVLVNIKGLDPSTYQSEFGSIIHSMVRLVNKDAANAFDNCCTWCRTEIDLQITYMNTMLKRYNVFKDV